MAEQHHKEGYNHCATRQTMHHDQHRCDVKTLAQAYVSKVGRLHSSQHEMHTLGIWECVLRFAHAAAIVQAVQAA